MFRNTRSAPSLSLFSLLVGIFLFSHVPAHAAVDYYPVDPITHGLSQPVDVAVGPGGFILVADHDRNLILVYNRAGVEQLRIPVDKPNTVAAGSNYIYAGSNGDLSVKIFDYSGNEMGTGTLGDGANEFMMTINIAVDPITDYVYVVDLLAHKIKIYEPLGAPAGVIDDPGAEPQDIAFNDTEIFLLDQAATGANMGSGLRSTRVVVFDRAGTILRTYTPQGSSTGQIYSAKGIAADNSHFFVSDAFHGVVLAFTSQGISDGAIQDPVDPMRTPMGLAIAPEGNKLFVVSPHSKSIKVFINSQYVEPPPPEPTPEPTPPPEVTPEPTPEPAPLTKKELKRLEKEEKKRLKEEKRRIKKEERKARRKDRKK